MFLNQDSTIFITQTFFFTVTVLLPEKPISTPNKFDLPCEKYKLPSNVFPHIFVLRCGLRFL